MRRSSLKSLKLSLLRYRPVLVTAFPSYFLSISKSVWVSRDLFIILLLLIPLTRSHVEYYSRGRTWTLSSQSETSLIKSRPGDEGSPLIGRVFYLKTRLGNKEKDLWGMLAEESCCLFTSPLQRPWDPSSFCCLQHTWTFLSDALQCLPICCNYCIQ